MSRKFITPIMVFALVLALVVPLTAQQSAVRGNLAGTVMDTTGAVVPGAKVTATGQLDTRTVETDQEGRFTIQSLIPGNYMVRVEKQGFKTSELKNVEVVISRTASLRLQLDPGAATETIEVSASAVSVDPTSTAVSSNLTDDFYTKVPIGRGVASIFYAAPGVSSGLGTGQANPSISGGTGLENNYIADGVQINDAAFGGLGVYSRIYGSIGTGINLSFIKEVQVKTAGFEPQYGKSTGGVVQIVTKSGSREFHGGISGFAAPAGAERERLHPDDFGRTNKFGRLFHARNYDLSGELSGYIPGFRDNLFFFGSYNPSWNATTNGPADGSGAAQFLGSQFDRRTFSHNYSGKLTFKLNDSNQIESSVYGDPSSSNTASHRTRNFENTSSYSSYEYGSRNWVARYNGALTPTFLVNAAVTWNHNEFTETPAFPEIYNVVDLTQTAPGQRGQFTAQGIGFIENYDSDTWGFNVDASKTLRLGGEHTFSLGYRIDLPQYDAFRDRTGPRFAVTDTNRDGTVFPSVTPFVGELSNAQFRLRPRSTCTICPTMNVPGVGPTAVAFQQIRGEFGNPVVATEGRAHTAFFNDVWSINKFVTLNLGVRYEQQRLVGDEAAYTFDYEFSPRLGVIVDPFGDRKTKISANFSRLFYHIPLDMALRSLSGEKDYTGGWWLPVDANGDGSADLNQFGTAFPLLTSAGLLNSAAGSGIGGSPAISIQTAGGIKSGTRMQYLNEWSAGFERDMGQGIIVSARYIDRRFQRIVEDIAGVSPEGFNAGLEQFYFITNANANTDLFVNERPLVFAAGAATPAGCGAGPVLNPVEDSIGNIVGAVCFPEVTPGSGLFGGEQQPDGNADGFPNPQRIYRAVEMEVNKGFSNGYLIRANYRIADLKGNFEGAFRNDNGQSDPSITSLFDFVQGTFGLLGSQFDVGPLNTDRRHTINGFFSYTFDRTWLKNFSFGTNVRVQSGFPLNALIAHPAYLNQGEVPVGGRGSLGRSPVTTNVDFNLNYLTKITERQSVQFGIDLFNVGNRRTLLLFDQNQTLSAGTPNADFRKPGDPIALGASSFQRPFYARFNVKWSF